MNVLNAGANLGRGESLQSPSGTFALTLQDDGNLVLTDGGNAVWAAGTDGQGVDRLAVQEDGNAVLYAGGDAKWSTGTQGNDGARLELQDDRNLVLYSADGSALWSSGTAQAAAAAPEAPAESAPEPGAAPAAPAAQEYVVVSGDTLSAISQRFYGDANHYMKIAQANGIANPDYIQVGQKLVIP